MYLLVGIVLAVLMCLGIFALYPIFVKPILGLVYFAGSVTNRIEPPRVSTRELTPEFGALVFDDDQGVYRASGDVPVLVNKHSAVVSWEAEQQFVEFQVNDPTNNTAIPVLITVKLVSLIPFASLRTGQWYGTHTDEWKQLVRLGWFAQTEQARREFSAKCAETLVQLPSVVHITQNLYDDVHNHNSSWNWRIVATSAMSAQEVKDVLSEVALPYGYLCVECAMTCTRPGPH